MLIIFYQSCDHLNTFFSKVDYFQYQIDLNKSTLQLHNNDFTEQISLTKSNELPSIYHCQNESEKIDFI